jgi:hypothetical protein
MLSNILLYEQDLELNFPKDMNKQKQYTNLKTYGHERSQLH